MSSEQQLSAWSPLRHKIFLWLWVAGLVGNGALWMQNVGAAWLMTSLAASPLMVALVQTATTLPAFLFNLPGGVMADRVDRRRWLLFTQCWMLVSAGLLSACMYFGLMGPWPLLILTFALGIGSALNLSAWSATAADLVPRPEVPAAIALNGVSYNLARVVGPAAAGAIIGWLGVNAVFTFNSICFAGVVAILYGWGGVQRVHQPLPPESLVSGMRTGLRYARHSSPVLAVVVRTVIFGGCASGLWALLPLVARDQLHLQASGYGLLLGSLGAGAIICAFILPALRRVISLNVLVTSSNLVFALAICAAALLHTPGWVCFALLLGGIAWMAGNATTAAVLQTNLPTWVRARVVSIYLLSFQGSMALGGALWGGVASHFGVVNTLLVSAACLGLGTLVVWRQRFSLGSDAESTLWPQPTENTAAGLDIDHREGPVAVQLDYRIGAHDRHAFLACAHALGLSRKRNGARGWRLYRDLNDVNRYSERFVVDSWLDYLRQQGRWTLADRTLEERLLGFQEDASPVQTHYYISEQMPVGTSVWGHSPGVVLEPQSHVPPQPSKE